MHIPIHFGNDLYGHYETRDGSNVATCFFHIYHIPLLPLDSYRQCPGGWQAIGLHLPSLLSGYFKTWGLLAAIGLGIYACRTLPTRGQGVEGALLALGPVALLSLVAASWLWLGRRTTRLRPAAYILSGLLVAAMAGATGVAWSRADEEKYWESEAARAYWCPGQTSAPTAPPSAIKDFLPGDEVEVEIKELDHTYAWYRGAVMFKGKMGYYVRHSGDHRIYSAWAFQMNLVHRTADASK